MKKLLLLLLFAVSASAAQTQADTVWTRFDKKRKDDYTFGYKDAAGRIRIPAKFGNFSHTLKFRHIMAVNEDATLEQYYLLKNGQSVGRDSVYMFDYTFDCESEGKIRFRDRANDRVGFFDSAGHVAIPAVYNSATPFHNGLSVALIGAKRQCLDDAKDPASCEHWVWTGGRTVLLNAHNEILVDSMPAWREWDELNWYSLKVNASSIDTTITSNLRAVNGDWYSFINYRKEFTRWFYDVFVPAIRTSEAANAAPLCFSELAAAGKPFRGWPHFERDAFIKRFYQPVLRPSLGGLRDGAKEVYISSGDLNIFTFHTSRFQSFYTDCNQPFQERYPTFTVVVNKIDAAGKNDYDHQKQFLFIRTSEGYRLFSMAL